MASTTVKSRCATCGKEKAILKCGGCAQDFCYTHFGDHRQQLNVQLQEVEVNRDVFRQTLTDQTTDPQKHPLVKQINQWERDSIRKIQKAAEEAREMLLQHTTEHTKHLETKLNELTKQVRQSREDNDFFETDLHKWNEQLIELTKQLDKPSTISLRYDSKPFVSRLYVESSTNPLLVYTINSSTKWKQNGITVAGGNGEGGGLNKLYAPVGMCIVDELTICVADMNNHRIIEWKNGQRTGRVVAGGNGQGSRADQLNEPTDVVFDKQTNSIIICDNKNRRVVRWPRQNGSNGETIFSNIDCRCIAMDSTGYLYVSDTVNDVVRRWRVGEKSGTIVAGGNGRGSRLDQLNDSSCIFVDEYQSVYVSDWGNNRVMKWTKGANEGIVVAGGQGAGSSLSHLSGPQGLYVNQFNSVYVTDFNNNRVVCWREGAAEGIVVVGGNGEGNEANQFFNPQGLSVDKQGNLYVVDQWNHRVQKFVIDSN